MGEEWAVGVRVQPDPSAAASEEAEIVPEVPVEAQAEGPADDCVPDVPEVPVEAQAEGPADDCVPDVAGLDGELEELVAKASERDEYLALAQRTKADFENYRKRVAREAAAAESRGLARLARELLPALDSLDRALAASADAGEALLEGLRLVQRELLGALERADIESYGAVGEQFDPELHEAVAQQPFEGREPGEIVEVYQPGYRLAGGVIRPARVLVAG
jgi:molecular chaperone GrpE